MDRRTGRWSRWIVVAILGALVASGCGASPFSENRVRASGEIVEDDRELEPFTSVSVEGPVEVTVIADGTHRVQMRMDRELERLAMITTGDGSFELDFPNSLSVSGPIVAELTIHVERLDEVDVSGAARLSFDRMDGERVRIGVSGASELVGGSITGGELHLEATGASDVDASVEVNTATLVDAAGASRVTLLGTTKSLRVDAAGASNVDAAATEAADVDVELQGASTVWVRASDAVDGDLHGASTLHVRGDAAVSVDTTGASSIERS